MQLSSDALAVAKDLNGRFNKIIRKPRTPLYTKVCEVVPSDGAFEKYPMITAVPFPTEWSDMRTPDGIRVTNILNVNNLMYQQRITIDANLVADSKAWELNQIVTKAAQRCVEFPDKLCSALLDAGVNANTPSITDPSTAFYATTKSFGGLGINTFSNKLTGSGTTALQVASDFFAARAALKKILDNEGGLVNGDLKFDKNNILVRFNPDLEGVFDQVLNTSWSPQLAGASGENVLKGAAEPFSDGYMSDHNDFDIHVIGEGMKPFIYQEREKLRSKLYTPNDSPIHDINNTVEILASYRFAFAYAFPEHSVRVVN